MSEPRFLPPKGQTEHHMANTAGHSCVVYAADPKDKKPGTIISEHFRRQAIADGCGIVGIDDAKVEKPAKASKTDLIVAAMKAVLDRAEADDLGGDDRPKLDAVSKQAGFKVTKTQYDEAWPKYMDSVGAEDDEDDGQGD